MREYGVFLCLLLSSLAASAQTTYGDLPLYAYGVHNSNVTIKLDEELLVPSLSKYSASEFKDSSAIPYPGTSHAKSIGKFLSERKDISLGHAMPYYYIALNQALNRVFHNLILRPREEGKAMAKRFGTGTYSGDRFANIRDLIQLKDLKNVNFIFEIYSSEKSLKKASKGLKFHGARAFWDPDNNRIGMLINSKIFHWLPAQASWSDQSVKTTIIHVRDYVSKLVLETMTHELIHLVQHSTQVSTYRHPLLSEVSALFVAENVSTREEMKLMAGALTARGLPLKMAAKGTECRKLIDMSPSYTAGSMARIAETFNKKNVKFSVKSLLLAGEKQFYNVPRSRLKHRYNLGLAIALYINAMPRQEFEKTFARLLRGEKNSAQLDQDLGTLDKNFAKWIQNYSSKWWLNPEIDRYYPQIRGLVTRCLNKRDFSAAIIGTRVMVTAKPDLATGWLYAGDVFWRTRIPFVAFDYYAKALQIAKQHGYGDESKVRIYSRMGDALETLGDIKGAVKYWKNITSIKIKDTKTIWLITSLRTDLKNEFYKKVIARNQRQNNAVLFALKSYIDVFQLAGCQNENEQIITKGIKKALSENNTARFRELIIQHYHNIRKVMLADLPKYNDYEKLLEVRKKLCKQVP